MFTYLCKYIYTNAKYTYTDKYLHESIGKYPSPNSDFISYMVHGGKEVCTHHIRMFWSATDCIHDGVLCLVFTVAAAVVLIVALAILELTV